MITRRELEKELSQILPAFTNRELSKCTSELEDLYNRYLIKIVTGKWSWSFSPELIEDPIGIVVIEGELRVVWTDAWREYFGECYD